MRGTGPRGAERPHGFGHIGPAARAVPGPYGTGTTVVRPCPDGGSRPSSPQGPSVRRLSRTPRPNGFGRRPVEAVDRTSGDGRRPEQAAHKATFGPAVRAVRPLRHRATDPGHRKRNERPHHLRRRSFGGDEHHAGPRSPAPLPGTPLPVPAPHRTGTAPAVTGTAATATSAYVLAGLRPPAGSSSSGPSPTRPSASATPPGPAAAGPPAAPPRRGSSPASPSARWSPPSTTGPEPPGPTGCSCWACPASARR